MCAFQEVCKTACCAFAISGFRFLSLNDLLGVAGVELVDGAVLVVTVFGGYNQGLVAWRLQLLCIGAWCVLFALASFALLFVTAVQKRSCPRSTLIAAAVIIIMSEMTSWTDLTALGGLFATASANAVEQDQRWDQWSVIEMSMSSCDLSEHQFIKEQSNQSIKMLTKKRHEVKFVTSTSWCSERS